MTNAAYTQYFNSWLSDLLQSELQMKLLEVEGAGHVPQCPIAGDAAAKKASFSWDSTDMGHKTRLAFPRIAKANSAFHPFGVDK